jgi:sRNA-binding regulator protein Hfq
MASFSVESNRTRALSNQELVIMNKRISRDFSTAPAMASELSSTALLEPPPLVENGTKPVPQVRKHRPHPPASTARHFAASSQEDHGSNRQAELFYLQKQIQLQTQMVIILEDGARVQGVIEWYDRNSIKVRGKARVLVYKSAIKYLYKAGEIGSAPEE